MHCPTCTCSSCYDYVFSPFPHRAVQVVGRDTTLDFSRLRVAADNLGGSTKALVDEYLKVFEDKPKPPKTPKGKAPIPPWLEMRRRF